MADNWVSPTSHNDPDSKWVMEVDAYDGDTGSSAANTAVNYDHYLELTIAAIQCDKVRIYAQDIYITGYNPDLDIDVYYSSAWHNIFSGTITKLAWVEKAIGSTQTVTKARVKSNTSDKTLRIYEFEFNLLPPIVETDACTDVKSTSFDANGDIIASGGATKRGFHYSKVFDNFEWGSDGDPLSDDGGAIDWTISAGGTSKAEIDTAQHYSGTRSARLYRDGTNSPLAYFTQSPVASNQVIQFRARKDDAAYLQLLHSDASYSIFVVVKTDETIRYNDGVEKDTGATVSTDTWFCLAIKNVNWVAHTYDIYLDGVLIKQGAAMRNAAYVPSKIRFGNFDGDSNIYLDEVAVWDVEDESGSFSEGTYSLEITGLDSGTAYYVQAFAENTIGFGYGVVVTCRTIIAKVLSDTVAINDALVKSVSITKAEMVTISDTIVKAISLAKADTITIADSISKALSLVKADAVTITDSISKAVSIVKADAMAITDALIAHIGLGLSIVLSDVVTIRDRLVGELRVKIYLKQSIARMQIKGMDIARMQVKRMGIDKMPLYRWIIRRWTA